MRCRKRSSCATAWTLLFRPTNYNPLSNRFKVIPPNGYQYDATGNLTKNNTTTWTYNARGRLASVKLPSTVVYNYGINGLGQRVSKTSTAIATGKQLYSYDDAGHLIGEYNNSGARLSEHIYLGDLPVAVINSTGSVFYILSDHLGTPRQIINATKQLRWQWDNTEPFGANTANQNPATLGTFTYNLRFAGQYFDAETGLHYNNFRDYDPQTGRYIESDPIGLEGGINTYGYVGNNPISYIDVKGLSPQDVNNIHQTFNSTITNMTQQGLRNSSPFINNQQRFWGNLTNNKIGDSKKKDCGEQTYYTNEKLDKGKYDDKWTFSMDAGVGHAWGVINSYHNI